MYAAPQTCPVCQDPLVVTRLECRTCDTSIAGTFHVSGLAQLSPEQLTFVETFVRCEGKFNRMEKEVGLSYPTLRSRLHEIIFTLGYRVGAGGDDFISEEERAQILDQISSGKLTAEEAMALLENKS